MKLPKLDPHNPVVIDRVVERIRRMTPEEMLAFLNYRTPGIEETDMTGMMSEQTEPALPIPAKPRVTSG